MQSNKIRKQTKERWENDKLSKGETNSRDSFWRNEFQRNVGRNLRDEFEMQFLKTDISEKTYKMIHIVVLCFQINEFKKHLCEIS